MPKVPDTVDQTWKAGDPSADATPHPGIAVVFTSGAPVLAAATIESELVLGRGPLGSAVIEDPTVSRKHAQVTTDGATWRVRDLGSHNGTAVDGTVLAGEWRGTPTVIRVGDTLALPLVDVTPLLGAVVLNEDGAVLGPRVADARRRVVKAAADGSLLLRGESGSGKELFARLFHRDGPRARGPFVAVNCATIERGIADRLLFGARKGAYSGADENADGYLQAADGGTLFLDEIGELDAAVQAKLLRVIETKEVLAVGATKPQRVDLGLVAASHRDLRADVASQRFRADLYFRIATPEVRIPPLRDRREEIPWIVKATLAAVGKRAHVSLLEACLLRPWPGNIRELVASVRAAASATDDERVPATALAEDAGKPLTTDADGTAPDRTALESALAKHGGNVSAAARALGVHRTQLRRWLDRYGIAAKVDSSE